MSGLWWCVWAGAVGVAADDDAKEDPKEEAKWDVAAPPGPAGTVDIDTRTGTWLSVDVAPDGRHVVFDLLGDLYEIPMSGGEATALTSGMAWDMQPRYSPDGQHVAFTSDRGGGDNLWILPRGGGEPTEVTHESFRLLNSPAWTPDGGYLLGRKHFTSTRSVGAGEIWLYDRHGSDGLQLTERQNEQKDLGEPAISPDGRYVYYSLDATPGGHFQYNKDSNGAIYAIERLDRTDGRIERIVGGAGGACRPTPHPNGRHLAYVRRIRDRSVLMLHDMVSGGERRLWDGLDRDHQETWAIHGVYPSMAWTPDGKALVLWAQGRLWRAEIGDPIGSGEATLTEIPFHVQDTREIRDAVRFAVEVAPARFEVRMLRGARVSPDGGRVVYEALGTLWIRDLPDGTPRRLTTQNDHREGQPAWSRDGKEIAYVSWDDVALGNVRVVKARGGAGKVVTTEPGHYGDPAFSPDGKHIAFRRDGGGWLTSARWSRDPGLYLLDRKQKTAIRLTRDEGRAPHFGADGQRVYFVESRSSDKPGASSTLDLKSLDLADREVRTVAHSGDATDMRVSPDGRWLAFQEGYNAYVTPFVATGRTLEVGPKGGALPVAQVSKDAGNWLHFAGEFLHWTTGPTLYSASVPEALAPAEPPDDEDEEDARPEAPGISIGFSRELARPTGMAAIVGARLVTMRGDEVIEDGTVLWEADRIVAVGPRAEVRVPAGAHVVDGSGHTVIPGLVDVHAHGAMGANGFVPQQNFEQLSNLSFGVTTIHDPSNHTASIFAASELQKDGRLIAPRIFSTGTILYGAMARGITAQVDSLDDALSHLRRMKAVGAVSVKSYNQPRRDQRQQVLEAGRQLGVMVVPEGGSLLMHNLTQIVDGHTGIEHSIPVAHAYDDVLQLWSATAVGYTPTLGVAYGGISGERWWYAHTDVWDDARLLAFVPHWAVDPASRRREIAPDEEYNHIDVAAFAKQLIDAGGRVQIGAHGQREGLAAHWELWMLEQGGMTPHEALRAGTLMGAQYLGLDGDIGAIDTGRLADFAVIAGNPLDDLSLSKEVAYTVLGGRIYDAATMNPEHPPGPSRPPLWWQEEGTALPNRAPPGPSCGCGAP